MTAYNQYLEWWGDEIVATVLETTGHDKEPNAHEWAELVNVTAAREWLAACWVAEEYHRGYVLTRSLWLAVMKRANTYRENNFSFATKPKAQRRDKIYRGLCERRDKLALLRQKKWERWSAQHSKCWELSSHLFTGKPQAEPVQPRKRKSRAQMLRYWDGRLRKAEWELGRAEGRLEKLEARRIGNDSLTKHFCLGRVGGSGKNVQKLNRKREREMEATFQLAKDQKAARERVAMLKSRVARYLGYWRKWDDAPEVN